MRVARMSRLTGKISHMNLCLWREESLQIGAKTKQEGSDAKQN